MEDDPFAVKTYFKSSSNWKLTHKTRKQQSAVCNAAATLLQRRHTPWCQLWCQLWCHTSGDWKTVHANIVCVHDFFIHRRFYPASLNLKSHKKCCRNDFVHRRKHLCFFHHLTWKWSWSLDCSAPPEGFMRQNSQNTEFACLNVCDIKDLLTWTGERQVTIIK